jgi:hypothetical protein
MILPQLGQSGAFGAYSSECSRRMNKAVLEPRCPNNIGSLLELAWDIGDSHHVLYHHRANVIAPGSSANASEAIVELMTVRLAKLVSGRLSDGRRVS